jgi:hypothetical protein
VLENDIRECFGTIEIELQCLDFVVEWSSLISIFSWEVLWLYKFIIAHYVIYINLYKFVRIYLASIFFHDIHFYDDDCK